MEHPVTITRNLFGKEVTISTGKLAKQANGSVLVSLGKTEVLGTAVIGKEPDADQDFFPLSVHYIEKFYAAGRIPGGYFRREAKPTDGETLVSRMIDRPLRPLFPEGFLHEVQVLPTVMSMDQINSPDIAGMLAASAALVISDIPFNGPVGSVRVARVDGKLIINPTYDEIKAADLDLVVAGTSKAITMIEGDALELSEDQVLEAVSLAHEAIKQLCDMQNELREKAGKPKIVPKLFNFDADLKKKLTDMFWNRMAETLQIKDKHTREAAVKVLYNEAGEKVGPETSENLKSQIKGIMHDVIESGVVRDYILNKKQRIDGRAMNELRQIACEVDVLNNVHGSALFTRGQTQAMAITTLGSGRDQLKIEEVHGEHIKTFFLHYNFPPFSVGETGRIGATGRREVGHGMLAERSLMRQLPKPGEFDFTIRVVSEVLESNGSSSMATICAGCMSMMAAGVPVKNLIAGVAMGLVMEGDKYQVLTDIQGIEDHLGDMDFKVAGTRNGITGFQLDIKVEGITPEIMATALSQAKEARMIILDKMAEAIPQARPSLSINAPQVAKIQIPADKVRMVIGPSGKNIKAIVEKTGSSIDINDAGVATIFAHDGMKLEETRRLIEQFSGTPKIGQIYDGTVRTIKEFGAFVEIFPGTDGLVHISELAAGRVGRVGDVCKEGDKMRVKVMKVDDFGKISLSRKAVIAEEEGAAV